MLAVPAAFSRDSGPSGRSTLAAGVIDSRRDIRSYTVGEIAKMSPIFLAHLAVEAEEKSAALWAEHQDGRGEVPADIEEHARLLSRLSDLFAYLARQGDTLR